MVKLSIVVITYNEERNLARCLDSVKEVADEILVIDSYSTDNTVSIANDFNAHVVVHPFAGYAEQKNYASTLTENNWILSLDADEALTPQLIQSILEVKKDPKHSVYQMPRLTNYCGKWIKHCGWYPDRQTRLYDRTKGKWEEKKVHEFWRPDNTTDTKGLLPGDLLHYSFNSISEHLKKIEKYTELAAKAAVSEGKRASLLKIAISPRWHFITEYFFKLGFLDGFYGYTICRLSAYSTFVKYSKIRMYGKGKK